MSVPTYGHNDENMVVHCHLCDWKKQCTSMESIELFFQKHVKENHGMRIMYRKERETGKVTYIPDIEEA